MSLAPSFPDKPDAAQPAQEPGTHADATPVASSSGRQAGQALAWAQTVVFALSVAAGIVIGLTGPLALGITVAGAGAAVVGGVQITVHIRR